MKINSMIICEDKIRYIMKHLYHTNIIIQLVLIFLITACKNRNETEPSNKPNECTEYSCPLHKDKMSVALDKCPECGMQMINTDYMHSSLMHSAGLAHDSIANYHQQILEYATKIISYDNNSKEDQTKNIIGASRNLNKAMLVTENVDKLVFGKRRLVMKPHFEKINKLYAVATFHITAISNELGKPNYDKAKIKLLTEELKGTIYEVDKEQNIIRVKK
jgi:hypothetical protein